MHVPAHSSQLNLLLLPCCVLLFVLSARSSTHVARKPCTGKPCGWATPLATPKWVPALLALSYTGRTSSIAQQFPSSLVATAAPTFPACFYVPHFIRKLCTSGPFDRWLHRQWVSALLTYVVLRGQGGTPAPAANLLPGCLLLPRLTLAHCVPGVHQLP